MMKRKVTLAGLVLLMAAGLVFAGGGGQQSSGSTAAGSKPTLSVGMQTDAFISDYKNNYLTQYMEQLHNINIEFYMLPSDNTELRTKLALMVASNDLPDVIMTNALPQETILDYGSKGAFLDLTKYYNDPAKSPNYAKISAEDKALILNTVTMADGKIYSLVSFQPETWNLTPNRLYFNREWAAKLGLKPPTTTEELRQVLIAFRDRDPNGNGRKDEIGVYGWFNGGYGENITTALINSFIFYNPNNLALDRTGNTVIAPFADPAFRKALQYLNTLYKDGVLAASLFTDDQQTFRSVLNSNPPVVGITTAGSVGNWPNADHNPNYLAMAPLLPPLTGPEGVSYTSYTEYVPGHIAFITSKARDPELAWKFAESFYGEDPSISSRFGQEGLDWSRKPEDLAKTKNSFVDMGLYPSLTLLQLRDVWTKPFAQHWRNINPRYMPLERGNTVGLLDPPYDPSLPSQVHGAVNYEYYYPRHPQYILPALKYNLADATKLGEPITNINDYVKQAIAEFTIGTRDVNNDAAWNTYLQDMQNMGLNDWVSISQTTYNRQKR
ncbi:ABC transporter substrate-binding protein [Spirochaetia bacterium]|nr:ABC transporter substrate-binding protein [Spirochaetia bacterium]GHV86752.1 ABC transporter substrate-binding protein [Spirochaetia bacterium]